MKKIKNHIYFLGLAIMLILAGCSDIADEITSISYGRLFSPTELTAKVINKTNVRMTWKSVKGAESYTIEVFENGDLNFEGTPYKSITGITDKAYTVTGLQGETAYSIRLQAISSSKPSSTWVTASVTTDTEQIFYAVAEDDIKAKEVTLRWPAGETATQISLSPGDITHTITAEEIAAGAATIQNLTGETTYTAKLLNGTKVRGTMQFTTLVDIGDAIAVNPGDDLKAILDAASNGDSFVLFGGEYVLGDYSITKSVSISGYKASNRPIIYGRFLCGAAVGYLNLKTLVMDGTAKIAGETQKTSVFEVGAGCNLGALSISGSILQNYARTIIYNNTASTILGNVTISDCIVNNFPGDGGDGIDIRLGTLTSLTVEKSTFSNGFRSFLRLQTNSAVAFRNCTFYKISTIDNSNNSGLFRSSTGGTLEVSNCLFVQTGVANPTNASSGNWCKNATNMKATPLYSKNVYYNCGNLWVGLYTNPSDCSATEVNPNFKDAASNDFTVQNVDVTAGDPRWLP